MRGSSPVIYWDTCIFVAWLKSEMRAAGEMEGVRDFLEKFKRREIQLMTSVITLPELMPTRLPAGADVLLDDSMKRTNFTRVTVDVPVARLARELRGYYVARDTEFGGKTLSVPDCIHLATAILWKADEFHTFDANSRGNSLGLLPLSGNVAGHNLVIRKPEVKQLSLGIE